jgi:phage terminase large subunit
MAQGELQIEHTPIFTKNLEAFQDPNIRFIINQGGSRSSKSYSILQLLIYVALTTPNTSISVVRKYFPSLRTSIYRDFVDIMKDLNLYHENLHNMTAHRYDFPNGSTIEFFATIDEQKLRGKKRTHLFCNEANEISFEEYMQLVMRTSGKVFIDFNPSESDHWIYDLANTDTKAILIRSTYLDNTFLGQDQIDYIANMINVDENYYRIYALGIAPTGTTRIYSHFKSYTGDPGTMIDHCYGLDFGFNHPSVLMKISYNETGGIYIKEEFYKSNLIISELITLIRESCDDKTIYCDSARPEIIEELRRSGLNARGSDKNVKVGIDTVKSSQIYMDEKAVNAWKEYRQYSWKTNGNHILDEPVKLNDDAMDAIRYGIHTHKKKTNVEKPGIHTFKPQGMPKIYNGFANQVGRSNDWWNKED